MVKELLSPNILLPSRYLKYAHKVGVVAVGGIKGTTGIVRRVAVSVGSRAVEQPIPYVEAVPESQDITGYNNHDTDSQPEFHSVRHELESVVLTPQPIPDPK